MKVIVKKSDIGSGLMLGTSVLPQKASESLRTAWLIAENGKVRVVCNGGESSFAGKYEADIETAGKVGVNGKTLASLLSKMPAGDITMDATSGKTMTLSGENRVTIQIPMVNAEWFTDVDDTAAADGAVIPAEIFSSAINRTAFAVADESMEHLGCLYIGKGESGEIHFCALDGHKFAIVTLKNDELYAMLPDSGWMIKKSYLVPLQHFLRGGDIALSCDKDGRHVMVRNIDTEETLFVKLYNQGAYPAYSGFLDSIANNPCMVTLDRKDLAERLQRLALFESDNGPNFKIESDSDSGEVKMSAKSDRHGFIEELMDAEITGGTHPISFPTKKFAEVVGKFIGEKVTVSLGENASPCGVVGADDPDLKVVIMPMMSDGE